MVDVLTGTAFDAPRRMHHREDEVALEFPSSVSSRRRNLLALKAQNWRAGGSPTPPLPYDSAVEWIGDALNQSFNWFNLGIAPSATDVIRMRFCPLRAVGNAVIWCGGAFGIRRNMAYLSNTNLYWAGANVIVGVVSPDTVYDIEVDGAARTAKLSAGGQVIGTLANVDMTLSGAGDYCLLADQSGNRVYMGNIRIYSFSIAGKCDLIPVRIGSEAHLYDRLNPTSGPRGDGILDSAYTGTYKMQLGPDI